MIEHCILSGECKTCQPTGKRAVPNAIWWSPQETEEPNEALQNVGPSHTDSSQSTAYNEIDTSLEGPWTKIDNIANGERLLDFTSDYEVPSWSKQSGSSQTLSIYPSSLKYLNSKHLASHHTTKHNNQQKFHHDYLLEHPAQAISVEATERTDILRNEVNGLLSKIVAYIHKNKDEPPSNMAKRNCKDCLPSKFGTTIKDLLYSDDLKTPNDKRNYIRGVRLPNLSTKKDESCGCPAYCHRDWLECFWAGACRNCQPSGGIGK